LDKDPMSEAPPPKTYFDWMDTLRGFGIVLVIFGHQKPGPWVTDYLQAVMLAVFIFASGFLFSGKKYPSSGDYLKRRARSLLIPYLWFVLFSFLFWMLYFGGLKSLDGVVDSSILPSTDNLQTMRDVMGLPKPGIGLALAAFLLPALYGAASVMWFNLPLWFFPGLFVIDALFFWLHKRSRSDLVLLAWLVGFSVLGYLVGRAPIRLPWNVDTACSVVLYYGLGYLVRKRYREGWSLPIVVKILVAAAALALSIFIISYNPGTHPSFNQQGDYFLYHLGALTSILFFLLAAQVLSELRRVPAAVGRPLRAVLAAIPKTFDYIGRNAVVYIGAQVMTMAFFMTFNRFVFGIQAKEKLPSTPWALYYGIGAMVLIVPLAYVVNRWAPWILGRKKASRRSAGTS
jgi:fucose 4-O-acetylase-like acetyltransferase